MSQNKSQAGGRLSRSSRNIHQIFIFHFFLLVGFSIIFFSHYWFTVTWWLVDFNSVLLNIDNVVVSVIPLSEDSQSFQPVSVLHHHHLVTSQSAVLVHDHQLVAAVADFLLVGHLRFRPHIPSLFQNQKNMLYIICHNRKSSLPWPTRNQRHCKFSKKTQV